VKRQLITAILLILCGLGIGLLAYENLMWAVWGKQNRWFEYVGFWGCPIVFLSGLVVLKSLRLGSFLGCVGFGLMAFYLGPAIVNTIHGIVVGKLVLTPLQIFEFVLVAVMPMLTLVRLIWNLTRVS